MTGTGIMVAMSVISTGISLAQAISPPKAPSMGPLPSMEPVKQSEKLADRSVPDRIKATKSAMGTVATPKTLLSGTMGIEDEVLNLGGKLI